VERVKIALSSRYFDVIQLQGQDVPDIDLWQPLTRLQFEALIIESRSRLKPLPTLEGYVPEGWKDAVPAAS
jgi:hypothetical protein